MDHHVARPRRTFAGLAAMAAGAVALTVGAFPGVAGATGGDDDDHHENPGTQNPCPDDGWYWHWGPDNQEDVPGTHTQDDPALEEEESGEGEISFTISNVREEGDGKAFEFESSVPVTVVSVRGWQDDGNLNEFEPAATTGTATGGDDYIKHVIVCPAEEETPPSSEPTVPPSSTPTVPPSSTPTVPPSSTPDTMPPSSVPDTTPSSVTPTTEATTTTISSGGSLPNTGSNTGPMVAIGAGLLVVGVALVAGTRKFWSRFV
jgi:LPXTG-motif cell wall-anchored protein